MQQAIHPPPIKIGGLLAEISINSPGPMVLGPVTITVSLATMVLPASCALAAVAVAISQAAESIVAAKRPATDTARDLCEVTAFLNPKGLCLLTSILQTARN
jgi:hypothetical protein